jgi:hypothetical protein
MAVKQIKISIIFEIYLKLLYYFKYTHKSLENIPNNFKVEAIKEILLFELSIHTGYFSIGNTFPVNIEVISIQQHLKYIL